jgi:hypothetical protein
MADYETILKDFGENFNWGAHLKRVQRNVENLESKFKFGYIDKKNKEEVLSPNKKDTRDLYGFVGGDSRAITINYKSKPSSFLIFSENFDENSLDAIAVQGIKGSYYPLTILNWEIVLYKAFKHLGKEREMYSVRVISPYFFDFSSENEANKFYKIYSEMPARLGFSYNTGSGFFEYKF